jgi:hypothetical protein
MHKRDARAFGFDLRTKIGELGDRLAAKGSAEMAQEHEKQRTRGKSFHGFAGLRTVGLQEFGINALGLEHRYPIFADFHGRGNRLRGDPSPVRAGGMALFTDCLDIS